MTGYSGDCSAIGHDILVVLFKRARKAMVAVAVTDEIQILGVGGMHGSLERGASWIRNWAGRQAGNFEGVVEDFEIKAGGGGLASETARQQRRVNHARIRL